jgi:hypothetical protein
MKKLIITCLNVTLALIVTGQDKLEKKTAAIVKEGKMLYKSEMASWYGTDVFLEKYKDGQENIGGYFSYNDSDSAKCIFFSKGDNPRAIGTIVFDSTYSVNNAHIDVSERELTSFEKDMYAIRKKALDEINGDTLFKAYKNTNFNLIPLITDEEKRVFVLTAPKSEGVMLFGNDYLITFDKNNNIKSKKQLHKTLIPTEYSAGADTGTVTTGGMHSHVPSMDPFITSTDICTLMLYEKFTKWEQYYVITQDYISIWNCKTNQLVAITKDAWDKINKDQEKRHPDK